MFVVSVVGSVTFDLMVAGASTTSFVSGLSTSECFVPHITSSGHCRILIKHLTKQLCHASSSKQFQMIKVYRQTLEMDQRPQKR
eukprot:4315881-Amphidinium_carterae.1